MNDDREGMLAKIRANPEDDAPRLVFADWLEEHGEADLAAFIRLEIERDHFPYGDARWKQLHSQTIALRKQCMSIPGIPGVTRRGFFSSIQAVGIHNLRNSLDRLGPRSVQLSVLLHRDQAGQTPEEDAAFRAIFASSSVQHWTQLEMQKVLLTDELVRSMSVPGNLTGLEILSISDGANDDAVRELAQIGLPQLTGLGIHEVWRRPPRGFAEGWAPSLLTPAAVFALAGSPLLARLEWLSLWGDWLGDDELRALAESPRVTALRELYVWPRRDSWVGLQALLESPNLAGLKILNLSRISLTPEIVALLVRPEILPGLIQMHVNYDEPEEHQTLLRRRFGEELIEGPLEDSQGL